MTYQTLISVLVFTGITLIVIAVITRCVLYQVPPMHYGRISTFGRRGRRVGEGLTFLIPFVQKVSCFSSELQRIEFTVRVKSSDLSGILVKMAAQFRLDPELIFIYEEVFKNVSKALTDASESEIGNVAGTKKIEEFVLEREAIVLLINCLLRLKYLPHENPDKINPQLDSAPISIDRRLAFYKEYSAKIKQCLAEEIQKLNERSRIEENYGIDILTVDLLDIEFTPKTEAALESKKQNEATLDGSNPRLALLTKLMAMGLTGQQAIDVMEVAFGNVQDRRIISLHGLEGLEGILGLLGAKGKKNE